MEIILRPLRPDTDLPGLVELLNAVERAEGRQPAVTVEIMGNAIARSSSDRWVIPQPNEPERLIGYGVVIYQTPERCYGNANVHPAWRRRGIGRLLLDQLAAKTSERGIRYLTIDVDHANQDALRFLLTQGFRFRGDVWALVAPPGLQLPPPRWPDGYHVTTYADWPNLDGYVALCNQTFGDLWGHWENYPGLVDTAHMTRTLEYFEPDGIFIAQDSAGNAVGQCRAMAAAADTPSHTLDQPGVVPDRRAAGLHAPLALTAAHWLRAKGPQPIRLESWGDAAETIRLYESLGFELAEHEVSYVRELRP